ncbi:MAG: HIT domain-containing protein [Spirochaetales bacterium]|nr:HIT domain-containing protein [Spirochaetales bacterium]
MEYFCNFEKLDYIKNRSASGDCILCSISAGKSGTADLSVYRDDTFIVSLNLYPYNPGHLILFPLRHIEDLRELTREEQDTLHLLTSRFLDVLDALYSPAGYNIGYNMGKPAGASISHLHLHIIPRYPGEIGFADLIAGKRMLVEHPLDTLRRIKEEVKKHPL